MAAKGNRIYIALFFYFFFPIGLLSIISNFSKSSIFVLHEISELDSICIISECSSKTNNSSELDFGYLIYQIRENSLY